MCPTDSTPDPRDMMRAPVTQDIPQPRPTGADDAQRAVTADDEDVAISKRPALPDAPAIMAADVEDEEADPVVDSGPGIADGALNRK